MSPSWSLRPHEEADLAAAQGLLARLRAAIVAAGTDVTDWTWDHIGSTAVPGLVAKPFLDLQLGVAVLPDWDGPVDLAIRSCGFAREYGARPDSPGVDRDSDSVPGLPPATPAAGAASVYEKRLYTGPAILHVRRVGTPWWHWTRATRDWLRRDEPGRRAYAAFKLAVAGQHHADADYDDYTRAKSDFFTAYAPEILAGDPTGAGWTRDRRADPGGG